VLVSGQVFGLEEEGRYGQQAVHAGVVSALGRDAIIRKLREAEVLLGKGMTIPQAARKIGITEQTYYRWRNEYGGLRTNQAKRLKELEKENARLKKLVANLSLDNQILKEVASGEL
jgi:putative transposase